MDTVNIIDEYNRFERIGEKVPGCKKLSSDKIVKIVSPGKYGSFINYFDLSEAEADSYITNEVEYFNLLGKGFEWKVYDTDKPYDMPNRLLKHGFTKGDKEAFMVFDVEKHHARFAGNSYRCTKVTSVEQIKDAMSIHPEVWGGDFSHQEQALVRQFQDTPESVSIYIVYVNGKPVSSARITFNENSPFAGL